MSARDHGAGDPSAKCPPDRPVDGAGPVGDRSGTDTPAGPAAPEPVEDALRRMLHESVEDLRPSPVALETLRRAVPARRRRRHRLAASAASVVVLAVGTPAVLHATTASGPADTSPVGGGYQEGAGGSTGANDPAGGPGIHSSGGAGEDTAGDGVPDGPGEPDAGAADGDGATPEERREALALASPRCERSHLGAARTEVGAPDGEGHVHGVIRLANISAEACRVRGAGDLVAAPYGASGIDVPVQVMDRTEGDRATGLPTPASWEQDLVLLPGESYAVRFAWVPRRGTTDGGCPVPGRPGTEPIESEPPTTVGGAGEPGEETPGGTDPETGEGADGPGEGGVTSAGAGTGGVDGDGSPSTGSGAGGETGGSGSGGGSGDGEAEGAGEAGTVLRYTPAVGDPQAARIELPGVCTGTVYRTGVLADH
ncbi:hypothetical protein FNQ90_11935 [Streptomyces alkaliphilus]|uniref:DUF4232 domain-containing protein n=1 Tax=Streptomyces alkaliphilus TaxID=1472722 RepID=A0A7W3Y1W6_9ACTN|nr:DUF4232 domain-containing protein [Streptomyces alkaliphilus]MBB0244796.1 hypothetical protein [Streptomyces alkaliphilus]